MDLTGESVAVIVYIAHLNMRKWKMFFEEESECDSSLALSLIAWAVWTL